MRVLFVTQLLPLPLDAGPKIRAYYVLRHLADAGHQVTLVSFLRPGDDGQAIDALKHFCDDVHTVPLARSIGRDVRDGLLSLASGTPFLVRRDRSAGMTSCLARVVRHRTFDVAHADQLWMASAVMEAHAAPRTVLDQHNAVFRVPERLAARHPNALVRVLLRREASSLQRFEQDVTRWFGRVVWVSPEDRDAVCAGAGLDGGRHRVIPIAVDPLARTPPARPRPFRVTFLGGLNWPPNADAVRWFIRCAWPTVAAAFPSAVLTIIGRPGRGGPVSDPARRIEVTGHVLDASPWIAETQAFVVPLRSGAGVRVKILDAWSWGLPVVSTAVGAEGLNAVHGENLLLADDGRAFADAVARVLGNRSLARRLGANGRATVEAHYDWRAVYTAWDEVYQ